MALRLYLFLIFAGFVAAQGPNPVVRVAHGLIQGTWKVSTKGRSFASFQGVPYARPPIGKYRFREPQQMKQWTGVWDATKPLPACLQYEPFKKSIVGSENCLYVNIATPKLNPGANLPVLVFIHGGAFMYGEGSFYDPSHIMDTDMVVVTLNYRLGPLGFLSTGDTIVPGNNGLKDQSFALHWIKNNIMMFGGNPDSVTLSGSSAGGASVHYQFLSPLSRGTFARGIAYSGSALAQWTHSIKPVEKAKALAAIVGCPTTTNKEMVDCLKYRPAEMIVNAQIEMFEWKVHMFTPFIPTVEAPGVREPFLQQYPYHATRAAAMMNLPLIASVASEEGLYPAAAYQAEPGLLQDLEAHWDQLASNIFEYNDTLPLSRRAEVAAKIKQHYLGGKPVSQETYPQLVQALGDRHFVVAVGKLAELHAVKSGQPTYVYRYAYRGKTSLSNLMAGNDADYGVSHGDDVLSMFNYPSVGNDNPQDLAMVEGLIHMVYSFSTTGTPKLTNDGPEWLPVTPGAAELNYLDITSPTKMEMKTSADFGQKAFWDSLGLNENENYREYARDEL
ncbi:venom carboxylesterase-6-like [Trichoplusia ni]|uniref:Carboxylic ester hydrolase n=1 Tax=Trichoplusia ni TaxID=7111 RepID=A0A7E5WD29_TRINI|nr:venom carboxylesterase-6-like [Trichoplusia ni]